MSKDETFFDRRVIERNLTEGVVSRGEYDKYLKSLKDVEERAEYVSIETVAPKSYLASIGVSAKSEAEPGKE